MESEDLSVILEEKEKNLVFQYYNIFSQKHLNESNDIRILEDSSVEMFNDTFVLNFLVERIKRKNNYESKMENLQETRIFINKLYDIQPVTSSNSSSGNKDKKKQEEEESQEEKPENKLRGTLQIKSYENQNHKNNNSLIEKKNNNSNNRNNNNSETTHNNGDLKYAKKRPNSSHFNLFHNSHSKSSKHLRKIKDMTVSKRKGSEVVVSLSLSSSKKKAREGDSREKPCEGDRKTQWNSNLKDVKKSVSSDNLQGKHSRAEKGVSKDKITRKKTLGILKERKFLNSTTIRNDGDHVSSKIENNGKKKPGKTLKPIYGVNTGSIGGKKKKKKKSSNSNRRSFSTIKKRSDNINSKSDNKAGGRFMSTSLDRDKLISSKIIKRSRDGLFGGTGKSGRKTRKNSVIPSLGKSMNSNNSRGSSKREKVRKRSNSYSVSLESLALESQRIQESGTTVIERSNMIAREEKKKKKEHNSFLNKLLESINDERSNKKKLLDLLGLIEEKSFQRKLLKSEEFLNLLKSKLTSNTGTQQLFACRIINKLCKNSKKNRILLVECGVFKIIAVQLSNIVNKMKFQKNYSNPTKNNNGEIVVLFNLGKMELKILKENLTSVFYFSNLKNKSLLDSKMIESLIKLLKYGKFTVQKKSLKCLCNLCQTKEEEENFNTTLFKLCKLNAIKVLFKLLKKSEHQKETLFLFYKLSAFNYARMEIYNKGIFHAFLWLLRNEDESIQEMALKSLAYFVPNDNVHIDCLLLKYGLDLFIQFFTDYLNTEIVSAALKILAHLSEYSRIHLFLMRENVLNSLINRISVDFVKQYTYCSKSSLFYSHTIISNLTKFKEGQYELIKKNRFITVLESLEIVINLDKFNNTKKELTENEIMIIPKIVSRSIANLSCCEEIHSEIVKKPIIDSLLRIAKKENDRTVIWNVLCVICNLCKKKGKKIQKSIVDNKDLMKFVRKYSLQKEDEKLMSRAIRCFSILSRNSELLEKIIYYVSIHEITAIGTQTVNSEIQLDLLNFITNFSFDQKYHVRLIDSNCLKNVIVKLSYFPLSSFHTKVAVCLHNLSKNQSLKYILIKSGCVEVLKRLSKESKREVRKVCSIALKSIGRIDRIKK